MTEQEIKMRTAIIPIVLEGDDLKILKSGKVLEYEMGDNVKIRISYSK